jgi:uncharacterized protein YjbI with pentapeptide repeats
MSEYQPPQSAGELITRYQNGERYFRHSGLDELICDFRGVNLSKADFSHSFIVADFRGAVLKSVNFSHCNVKTCDFRGADLQGAIFREALLEGTEFAGAILDGANFEGAGIFNDSMKAGDLPDW